MLAALGLVAVIVWSAGCASQRTGPIAGDDLTAGRSSAARLRARPSTDSASPPSSRECSGLTSLSAGGGGLLYVPARDGPNRSWPLVVLLHGAGSNARSGLEHLRPLADDAGLVLLAPQSRGPTWDAVGGRYGPDVASIDALLEEVFRRVSVDPRRLALGGFSDGASYALSLGLGNGDLFTDLIAFSPGFVARGPRRGRPVVYVSHGVSDRVLPIERCSRRIVPLLRRWGYDVDYREFAGAHTVPPEVAEAAVGRLLRRPAEKTGNPRSR